MALTFSQGYMRGNGDPNLDVQIQDGGSKIPKLYIDDLTDSFYSFDDNLISGEKWVLLFCGFTTKTTDLKVLLQGPATGSVMTNALATANLIPLAEPYEGLGYLRVGNNGETAPALSVFSTNTITDWVLVELRDKTNPEIIRYNRAGLLKNNGEIYDVDGVTKLTFENIRNEQYYIAIKHRNHIGLMTKTPVDITSTIDFTTAATLVYGVDNRKDNAGLLRLRAGKTGVLGYASYNLNGGWIVLALKRMGYLPATPITSVYDVFDVTLNGEIKYNLSGNDRVVVLNSIGFDNLILEQIPQIIPYVEISSLHKNNIGQTIPAGTTAQRDTNLGVGTLRYNTDTNKIEFLNASTFWETVTSV